VHENPDRILEIFSGHVVVIHFNLPLAILLFPRLPYLDAVKFRIDEKMLSLRTLELNGHRATFVQNCPLNSGMHVILIRRHGTLNQPCHRFRLRIFPKRIA
jgi:hypothetical protein